MQGEISDVGVGSQAFRAVGYVRREEYPVGISQVHDRNRQDAEHGSVEEFL